MLTRRTEEAVGRALAKQREYGAMPVGVSNWVSLPVQDMKLLLTSSSLAGALLALLARASCFSRCFLPLAGLVWMRMWRVSSSERLNRFSQPG